MPRTVVGLFENRGVVDDVVREIEALGFPRNEVRRLAEPLDFAVTGVMSFPRLDFEVDLVRELTRIGASRTETKTYVDGLRRGGALVFATGSDEKVNAAAQVMGRHQAREIEASEGPEPELAHVTHDNATPWLDRPVQAGRVRKGGGGPCLFTW